MFLRQIIVILSKQKKPKYNVYNYKNDFFILLQSTL